MIYTCPKCGKKMDLSTEVLINSDYKVICPQCLSQLHIVGDYAYVPDDSLHLDTTVEPSHIINCPKCGHQAKSNAHFCPNCGASFDDAPSTIQDVTAQDVTVMPPPLPNTDPLYNEAVQFLKGCVSITPMMLRDRFNISNERAAELIRQLEAGGIIGPYNNGGPRQILIPHNDIYYSGRRRMYDPNTTPGQTGGFNNIPNGSMPRPRRMGCFTWLFMIMIFIFLMKACGL